MRGCSCATSSTPVPRDPCYVPVLCKEQADKRPYGRPPNHPVPCLLVSRLGAGTDQGEMQTVRRPGRSASRSVTFQSLGHHICEMGTFVAQEILVGMTGGFPELIASPPGTGSAPLLVWTPGIVWSGTGEEQADAPPCGVR